MLVDLFVKNVHPATARTATEVLRERLVQQQNWGDLHDDEMRDYHLPELIERRAERLLHATSGRVVGKPGEAKRLAVEIAALAVAFLDREDRAKAKAVPS